MKEDISHAIIAKQFMLYYQPQVDSTGLIGAKRSFAGNTGTRYRAPQRVHSIGEETGLICHWATWSRNGVHANCGLGRSQGFGRHSIGVNISARQFGQPDFVEHVLATLARTGANPNNLMLELTESMLPATCKTSSPR